MAYRYSDGHNLGNVSGTGCMTATLNTPVQQLRRHYGDEFAAGFGAPAPAPTIITRSLPHAELAVTELRVDDPAGRISERFGGADAYMVAHELRSYNGMEYWRDGRHVSTYGLRAGDTTISDLRAELQVKFEVPVHVMLWLVPRIALDAVADDANVPRIDGLPHGPGAAFADQTIRHLNLAAIAALRAPEQVNRLFADHLTFALAAHVAQTYGGMQSPTRLVKGGLALWQERRAKEMMAADLNGTTPLAEIATACGLSSGHFARAFRKSTGLAPHAWMLSARVERAAVMLRQPGLSLSEIALACGFADQSHFGRVFTQRTGLSPGAWRRNKIR
jgi:AraC-like DNA-binding protein